MSRFELKTVGPHCGSGSVVAVDGRDITASVRAVTITASPDGSHAEVQLRPTAFDLVVEARVVLHVTPAPGYVVISEPQPDGSVRHRCEPEPVAPQHQATAANHAPPGWPGPEPEGKRS